MADQSPKYRYTTDYAPEFDPYFNLIGRLALDWSEFEFSVNQAIWELANVERMAGTCMTSQLIGPGPRFRCLVAFLNLRKTPAKLVKAMNSLSKRAESLGRQRNRYLHDPMVLDVTDKTIHRMEITADRTVKHGLFPAEIRAVTNLINEIYELDANFEDLYCRVLAETPAWPRTQYEQSQGIRRRRPEQGSSLPIPELPPGPSQA